MYSKLKYLLSSYRHYRRCNTRMRIVLITYQLKLTHVMAFLLQTQENLSLFNFCVGRYIGRCVGSGVMMVQKPQTSSCKEPQTMLKSFSMCRKVPVGQFEGSKSCVRDVSGARSIGPEQLMHPTQPLQPSTQFQGCVPEVYCEIRAEQQYIADFSTTIYCLFGHIYL